MYYLDFLNSHDLGTLICRILVKALFSSVVPYKILYVTNTREISLLLLMIDFSTFFCSGSMIAEVQSHESVSVTQNMYDLVNNLD